MANSVFLTFQGGNFSLPGQATGDLAVATSANTWGPLPDVATGQVLASGGVGAAPAWTAAPTITGTNITGIPVTGVTGTAAALNTANIFTNTGVQGLQASVNANLIWQVRNNETGTAAASLIRLWSDNNDSLVFRATSTSHATYAGKVVMDINVAAGLDLMASNASGDLRFYNRGGVLALTLGASQAATFTGAIACANTVAASVATPSTHKVTMVIGGVTYYLLATNV